MCSGGFCDCVGANVDVVATTVGVWFLLCCGWCVMFAAVAIDVWGLLLLYC